MYGYHWWSDIFCCLEDEESHYFSFFPSLSFLLFTHFFKQTWSAVNPDIFTIFGGLKKVMSHTSSYGSYRAYLKVSFSHPIPLSFFHYLHQQKGSTPPRIPFLGVTLSDLTFIDDGNKTKFENGSEFETAEDTHWEDFVGEEKFNVSKCLMVFFFLFFSFLFFSFLFFSFFFFFRLLSFLPIITLFFSYQKLLPNSKPHSFQSSVMFTHPHRFQKN